MAAPRPAHGCGSGALLGRFGVLLQALLALCAFSTLMLKRFKEPKEERRPWRIWFYDTSKQAIGALFIHFANVFLSDLTEEDPCSLYLINFILDATLGMLLIWLGVKVVSWIVQQKKSTYLVFGEYGDPPQAAAWIGQCILYLLIMVFEKTVISLVLLIPGWTKLQQILLGYIPNPQLELILVMFVVPFIVNAIMFWVVDSLIMRKYKQKDTLGINGSIETPRARRTEESQMMWLEDAPRVALSTSCKRSGPVSASYYSSKQPVDSFKSEVSYCESVLLSPDMDFDQSESDQDISGLQRTNQKMKQPSYQVVI
ncbi:store-operated calcium entry regulator STIMATE isoform X2 [Columba livia]|uniref:store-operated calcium entry regulator STIMATE isoform X2 n=1 Tax=Columba livia TaxID=8932 RepID=UPI0028BFBA1C|nr:store-operated calcium entry regulator STIMATE isoform A [Columba livia]